MKSEIFDIANIPAVIYGENSDECVLFVHGQGGNKFEAERFANTVSSKGYQVLAIDLPGHGERTDASKFVPWVACEELKRVMSYAKKRWYRISLRATSIGVYFSLLAFKDEKIKKCLFVSPLLDMNRMIEDMMKLAGVTKEELKQKQEIKTNFGQTLSWKYYCYAKNNSVKAISHDTNILYSGRDELIPQDTVESFSRDNNCDLTILDGGEHWLHTPDELNILEKWEKEKLEKQ